MQRIRRPASLTPSRVVARRAANAKYDEPVEAKFPILEARLKEAIAANGHPDPAANIRKFEEIVAANSKLAVDEMFVKAEAQKINNFVT